MKKRFWNFSLLLLPLLFYQLMADQIIWMTPNPDYLINGVYLSDKNLLPIEVRLLITGSIDPSRFSVNIDGVPQSGKLDNVTLVGSTYTNKVLLHDGRQTIEVVYAGTNGTIRSPKLTVEYHADKPNLWLYAFGTKPLDLQYSADDARDIAALFRQQEGKMYAKVTVKTLIGPEATGPNMRAAIEELQSLAQINEIHPQDVVIVFVSSHGFIDDYDNKLYLEGTEFKAMTPTSTSLPFEMITEKLNRVNCKKLVFVDACHSGGGKGYENVNEAMRKLLQQQNGITAIASSESSQISNEDPAWQNGAFTEALIKGFNGAGDTDNDGFVTIDEIWNYVYQEVPSMVLKVKGKLQRPSLVRKGLQDIPVFTYKGVTPTPPPVTEKDSDGDGIADARDACPYEKGSSSYNGCPPPKDSDGDGIVDTQDACPNEKGSSAYNGCPPPKPKDSDGDGIVDDNDNCPYEKGTAADRGCPPKVPANMAAISSPSSVYKMGDTFGEGYDSEKNTHSVTLTPFVMDKYETTFEEFDRFCEATGREKPSDSGWGRGKRPVINVSWYDAVEYANWRSTQEGKTPCYTIEKTRQDANNTSSYDDKKWTVTCNWSSTGYRLPTEAEWEYAASWDKNNNRKTRFGNGKDIADAGEMNFNASESYKESYSRAGEYRSKTLPVGSFSPNSQGLYDMSGNVWEWCWDWYGGTYSTTSESNPHGPSSGSGRVNRGGSWLSHPQRCRVASRGNDTPTGRNRDVGFRLVSPQ